MSTSSPDQTPPQPPAPGLLLTSDLMFRVRICDTAQALGFSVIARPAAAEPPLHERLASVRLLILDLDSAAVVLPQIADLRTRFPALTILAYGSHVERDLLQQARQAGCHDVLPRSKMTTQLVALLQRYLSEPPPAESTAAPLAPNSSLSPDNPASDASQA